MYEPKRRGGKFCSTSCRVVQHQLAKKGNALPPPTMGDELYLANKLIAVGRTFREALTKVEGLPTEQALAELRKLVQGWAGIANNSVIERIIANDTRARDNNYERYRKQTELF